MYKFMSRVAMFFLTLKVSKGYYKALCAEWSCIGEG